MIIDNILHAKVVEEIKGNINKNSFHFLVPSCISIWASAEFKNELFEPGDICSIYANIEFENSVGPPKLLGTSPKRNISILLN